MVRHKGSGAGEGRQALRQPASKAVTFAQATAPASLDRRSHLHTARSGDAPSEGIRAMALCPFAYREYLLTQPGSYKPGANGPKLERIVIHHNAVRQDQISNHALSAWNTWTAAAKAGRMQSAHFMVEPDGRIFQLIDTADIGFGTATYTGRAVHIEHAGNGQPFTRQQLHASALLIAWIKSVHPDVPLVPVGSSLQDFGDDKQIGITCHAWTDLAAIKFKKPFAPKTAKVTCPGKPMMDSIGLLARLAVNYAGAVPTVTSPVAAVAATFFDWSGGIPEPL